MASVEFIFIHRLDRTSPPVSVVIRPDSQLWISARLTFRTRLRLRERGGDPGCRAVDRVALPGGGGWYLRM